MTEQKPKLVDLFSGCGGFGLGGELAGFHSFVAVDVEPKLQSAYKLNFPKTRTITGDLSTMNEETWKMLLKDVEIDGVIGGPPCQGYSRQGHSDPEDQRRTYEVYRNAQSHCHQAQKENYGWRLCHRPSTPRNRSTARSCFPLLLPKTS